jgi:hypothetical protein
VRELLIIKNIFYISFINTLCSKNMGNSCVKAQDKNNDNVNVSAKTRKSIKKGGDSSKGRVFMIG